MFLGIRIGMKELLRVVRGGAWGNLQDVLPATNRGRYWRRHRVAWHGFRLVVRIKDE